MIFDYKKYIDKFHQWHLLYRTEIYVLYVDS